MSARRALLIAVLGASAAGCTSTPDAPVSFVSGLRVLGVRADPPEVAPGASAMVTLLVADTTGRAAMASWSRCVEPPIAGEAVNPECVSMTDAPFISPLGEGLSISAVMPQVTPAALGQPDATNGVYLPLVARVSDGADEVVAVYRLRLGGAPGSGPPNTNPTIAELDVTDAAGAVAPLDASAARVVHAGDALTLGVAFAPGSAEPYTRPDGAVVTETLTTSWFCTAGALSVERTGADQPHTVLRLAGRLPAAGQTIDLYAVAHDERGGADFAHRALQLQ